MAAAGVGESSATGGPLVGRGGRFLPVAASVFPPLGGEGEDGVDSRPEGSVLLPLAPGTPVHAVAEGRVIAAEAGAVGEVVLRIDGEVRLTYRRLQPSSVRVGRGDRVDAGDLLGVVARAADDGAAALELSARQADGAPADIADLVVGAADPLELFLVPPPMPGLVVRRRSPSPADPAEPAAPVAGEPPGASRRPDSDDPPPGDPDLPEVPRARAAELLARRRRPRDQGPRRGAGP